LAQVCYKFNKEAKENFFLDEDLALSFMVCEKQLRNYVKVFANDKDKDKIYLMEEFNKLTKVREVLLA